MICLSRVSMTVRNSIPKLLYPIRCCLCGEILPGTPGYPVCGNCENAMEPIGQRKCLKCGRPLISEDRLCMYCRIREYLFIRNQSLFEYGGFAAALIKMYKFDGMKNLSCFFAGQISLRIGVTDRETVFIPVPSSPKSKRKRGWDQMWEIAKILKIKYGLPVRRVLKRKASKQQKTLNYSSRCENLENRILYKAEKNFDLKDRKAVLLDDVFTTGATVNECTRVLIRAGCREVSVITIAID